MLIISQDRCSVVNFERIRELSIFEPFENDSEVWIYADDIELGVYKDSMVAKDIFRDILFLYKRCNAFGAGFVENDYYYMPEE